MSEKRKTVDIRILYAILVLLAVVVIGVSIAVGAYVFDVFNVSEAESRYAYETALAESSPTIYDYQGNVTDLDWLYENFGTGVQWERTELWESKDSVFRLMEIRAQCDYAALKVCVKDENGNPLNGINVVRYWPGAPALPDFSEMTKQWTLEGVYGPTEGEGCVAFGMGVGDYYYVDRGETAVSAVYPASLSGPGDFFKGLGMLAGTNHCHLDSVWQRVSEEEPPPVTPTPEPTDEPGESWEIDITISGTIEKK